MPYVYGRVICGCGFLVVGFWFLVGFALLIENFSIRRGNLTNNQQPKTQNQTKNHCTIMLFSEIEENHKNIF